MFSTHSDDNREGLPSLEECFADDPEILYRWEIGALSEEEEDRYTEHFIQCPRCRKRLRELYPRAGTTELASDSVMETLAAGEITLIGLESNQGAQSHRYRYYQVLAGIVALAVISVFVLNPWEETPDMSDVDRDLKNARYESAWRQLEIFMDKEESPTPEIKRLYEEAGYLLARDRLKQGERHKVEDIARKLERKNCLSGRVLNLEIQAERQRYDEYTISSEKYLVDYGVALTGNSFVKGTEEIGSDEKRFHNALRQFSDTRSLRLNYAQYLLASGRAADSQREVGILLEGDTDDLDARNVFAMALFRQGKFIESKEVYLQMLEQDRNREETLVNLAICCMRLDEPGQAAIYFEQALKNMDDNRIARLIEEHLAHLAEEVGH